MKLEEGPACEDTESQHWEYKSKDIGNKRGSRGPKVKALRRVRDTMSTD